MPTQDAELRVEIALSMVNGAMVNGAAASRPPRMYVAAAAIAAERAAAAAAAPPQPVREKPNFLGEPKHNEILASLADVRK